MVDNSPYNKYTFSLFFLHFEIGLLFFCILNRSKGYSPESSFVFLPCLQYIKNDIPCLPLPQQPQDELPYTVSQQTQVLTENHIFQAKVQNNVLFC